MEIAALTHAGLTILGLLVIVWVLFVSGMVLYDLIFKKW